MPSQTTDIIPTLARIVCSDKMLNVEKNNFCSPMQATEVKKQRIEYIDLAKGFCILLVVLSHILAFYRTQLPYDSLLKCFRMPLYFFLSGVFFKQYENFLGFFKRKINKLLIPFVFFYITLGMVLPWVLWKCFGIKMLIFNPRLDFWQSLIQVWTAEKFPNAAIWFLMCLLEVNLVFYAIYKLARTLRWHASMVTVGLSLLCGAVGMTLSYFSINLPCYADSALTSIPFFALGYILNRKTRVMQKGWRYDKWLWVIVLACLPVLFWLAYPLDYRQNYFAGCYFTAHLCGAVGTIMTIFLAKIIGHVPVITYWGRYSIMILCTHQVVYQLLDLVLKHFIPRGWWRISTCMIVTMALYMLLIPLMRRFMPHVTAQKDVIKIDNSTAKK